jgi:hypothetical protein
MALNEACTMTQVLIFLKDGCKEFAKKHFLENFYPNSTQIIRFAFLSLGLIANSTSDIVVLIAAIVRA